MGPTDVRVHRKRVSFVVALTHKEKKGNKMAATERKHTKVEAAGNNLPSLTDDDGRMLQKLRFLYDIVFVKQSLYFHILLLYIFSIILLI